MSAVAASVIELDEHRFDLADRVRAFIADRSLDDLSDADLIELFMETLTTVDMQAALRQVLPRYFGDVRRTRFHQARASRWANIDHDKVEALRDRIFSEWVITAEGRKRFGDCTTADVQFLAEERFRQADRNTAMGKKFEKVAKAMKRAKVASVAELGDEAARLIADA